MDRWIDGWIDLDRQVQIDKHRWIKIRMDPEANRRKVSEFFISSTKEMNLCWRSEYDIAAWKGTVLLFGFVSGLHIDRLLLQVRCGTLNHTAMRDSLI